MTMRQDQRGLMLRTSLVVAGLAMVVIGVTLASDPHRCSLVLTGLAVLGGAATWRLAQPGSAAAYWSNAVLAVLLWLAAGVWVVVEPEPFAPSPDLKLRLELLLPTLVSVAFALRGVRAVLRSKRSRMILLFQHVFAAMLLLTSAVGAELLAGALVPPWPMRELRPVAVDGVWPPRSGSHLNSWSMRDVERTIEKPPGVRRVLFVGDSFMEGLFCANSIAGYTEQQLVNDGCDDIQCVTLGVVATNPEHYLYRMRSVGLKLSPDAVIVFVYAGNDFVPVGYGERALRLIAERPLPSILGAVMPRLTWLLTERLRLSEHSRAASKDSAGKFDRLQEIAALPYEDGMEELTEFVSQHYWREIEYTYGAGLSSELIGKALRLGGAALWQELQPRDRDREYLVGYRVLQIANRGLMVVSDRPRPKLTAHVSPKYLNATASYIEQMAADLEPLGIPLRVCLIPLADNVDPHYREFWRPWYEGADDPGRRAHRIALRERLTAEGFDVVDLTDVLDGVPGAYHTLDKHWTEKGHALAAARVAEIIRALF